MGCNNGRNYLKGNYVKQPIENPFYFVSMANSEVLFFPLQLHNKISAISTTENSGRLGDSLQYI